MNVVAEIARINEGELKRGLKLEQSWHYRYKDSAWIYVGGLEPRLSEGDVLCVFSQFGEIEDFHLVRDEVTGRSKGFAFIKYEDWLSTVLAVDNMNGVNLLKRTLRVDHKLDYKPPREKKADGEQEAGEAPIEHEPGYVYKNKKLANEYTLHKGVNLFAPKPASAPAASAGATALDTQSAAPIAAEPSWASAHFGHAAVASSTAAVIPASRHEAFEEAARARSGAGEERGEDVSGHRGRVRDPASRSRSRSRSGSRSRRKSREHGRHHKSRSRSRSRSRSGSRDRSGRRAHSSRRHRRSRSRERGSRTRSRSRSRSASSDRGNVNTTVPAPSSAAPATKAAPLPQRLADVPTNAAGAAAAAVASRPSNTGDLPPPLDWRGRRGLTAAV